MGRLLSFAGFHNPHSLGLVGEEEQPGPNDPTDYVSILKGLRGHFEELASGTPQMHTCWVLLVASGEIPVKILHVRPPKSFTKERPLVTEVELTRRDFPLGSNVCSVDVPDTIPPEIEAAVREVGIVGDHPAMKKTLERAGAMAGSDCPVLILGETGT